MVGVWEFQELEIHLALPAKFIHQRADHEGAEEASKREHGHGNRPQQRQGKLVYVVIVALVVGLVIKLFHDLENKTEDSTKIT